MAKTKKTTNTKKITIASVMKAMDISKNNKETMIIGDGEIQIEIEVKKRLTLFERADMVNSIVSMVWAQDENGVERFAPYLRKFAYNFNILNYFTNIVLPDDMDKVWEFVDNTDIAGMIIDFVGNGYIKNILREADEAIEYHKEEILKKSKLDAILDSFGGLMNSFGEKTENLDMNSLLELAEKYSPELKGELEKIFNTQVTEALTEQSVASSV